MGTKAKAKDQVIGVQAPPALVEKIDAEADGKGVSRSDVIRWALHKYFESDTQKEQKTA